MANHQTHPSLHFILFPFMAQGHMIPMVDTAKLLAQYGVTITIIIPPHSTTKFKNTLNSAIESGLPINLVEVMFPSQEHGLVEGIENLNLLDSLELTIPFFKAANMLKEPVQKIIEEMNLKPSCLIADMCLPYTAKIAKKFNIPNIIFKPMSCFYLQCMQILGSHLEIFETLKSDKESFLVPSLPDKVEFRKSQLPVETFVHGDWKEFVDDRIEADKTSYGVIVNTFEELEPAYVKDFKEAMAGKVWCIGPVSLGSKMGVDRVERGLKAYTDQEECVTWLDSKEMGSVLYVSIGSLCNFPLDQLKELGLGLEESQRPFIWVIRDCEKYNELAEWITKSGYEERIKERGLVTKGWSSQGLILSHSSVGGFLTHCGWNAILEGVAAGLPLITWPLFADQFCNEKLVVQVVKVGVGVGVEEPVKWGEEEKIGVLVDKEGVKKAIEELMGESDDAEERRQRIEELGDLAHKALEVGGSSYSNITCLLKGILKQAQSKE